jgi:hypothetical protein
LEHGTAVTEKQPDPPVRIVTIVGAGSISPLKRTPWEEVMLHTVSISAKNTFS